MSEAEVCFNSQRDGILQILFWRFKMKILSFNSQRDGILHSYEYKDVGLKMFQFPTGWNSTQNFLILTALLNAFQFPTGWNSTIN